MSIVDMVLNAYKETGVIASQGSWFDEYNNGNGSRFYGCGLGVLCHKQALLEGQKHGTELFQLRLHLLIYSLQQLLGADYSRGFVMGFDGVGIEYYINSEATIRGFKDGREAWDKCLASGLSNTKQILEPEWELVKSGVKEMQSIWSEWKEEKYAQINKPEPDVPDEETQEETQEEERVPVLC